MLTMAGMRTPPSEPEALIFHMISWTDTAKVLSDKFQEKFTSDFKQYGPSLLPPQMLFKVNSDGFYKRKGNLRTDFAKGADTLDKSVKDLQCRLDDMEQKNNQQHQATQLQLTTITSSLSTITKTISGLED
jgi:glutathionyl-hydroquinone reductase